MDGDPHVWQQVDGWLEAARVAHVMEHGRLGVMGHYYNGMLDIYSDLTAQAIAFGTHIQIVELDELAALRQGVEEAETAQRVQEFQREFEVQSDCAPVELARAARTSVALDRFVERHGLTSLAYYAEGTPGSDNEDVISSVILGCSPRVASQWRASTRSRTPRP